MKHITLEQMLKECVECILKNKPIPNYYYRTEYELGKCVFLPIEEIDLLDSRFRTEHDFSEYEWELAESHIYKATPEEDD